MCRLFTKNWEVLEFRTLAELSSETWVTCWERHVRCYPCFIDLTTRDWRNYWMMTNSHGDTKIEWCHNSQMRQVERERDRDKEGEGEGAQTGGQRETNRQSWLCLSSCLCLSPSLQSKDESMGVKGDSVSVKGESVWVWRRRVCQCEGRANVRVKGENVCAWRDRECVKGESVSAKGESVSVKGESVSVKGESECEGRDNVSVKGERVWVWRIWCQCEGRECEC